MSTPLDADALRIALPGWARIDVVARTGSTNADLLAAGADGAPDRTVLAAEHQHAGRGRLARTWESPPGSGLTFSVLLRPPAAAQPRFGWLPLLAGLAVVDAVRTFTGPACRLKWPNDVLLGSVDGADGAGAGGKVAGILAEVGAGPVVVVGIGINVSAAPPDQPGATALADHADHVDPGELLVAVLRGLEQRERRWRAHGGDPGASGLRADYRAACGTLGAPVRITLPGREIVVGIAEDVDRDGRLLVTESGGRRRAVAAGDVTHVRPATV